MFEALSLVSLAGFVFYFDVFIDASTQKKWVKKERQQLMNFKGFFPLEQEKHSKLADFQLASTGKVAYIEVDATKAVNLNSNTFLRVRQTIPYSMRYQPSPNANLDFLQGQCGNNFTYNLQPLTPITVDFKCCNFQRNTLDHILQPINFLDNTKTSFINQHISLKTLPYFSMLGILTYKLQTNHFQFSPSFLIDTVNKQDFFKTVDLFFKQKIHSLTIQQLLSGLAIVGSIGLFYLSNSESFKKKWNYWWGIDQIDAQVRTISARQQTKLRCQCGKCMNLFGECLHLSMCSRCYNLDNTCRICKLPITKPVTIFI